MSYNMTPEITTCPPRSTRSKDQQIKQQMAFSFSTKAHNNNAMPPPRKLALDSSTSSPSFSLPL